MSPSRDRGSSFTLESQLDDSLLGTLHLAGDRMLRLIAMLDGRLDDGIETYSSGVIAF